MQFHANTIKKCQVDKEKAHKVYGGKFEMSTYVHYLTLMYLRGIRAYHLRNEFIIDLDIEEFDLNQQIILGKFSDRQEMVLYSVGTLCACFKVFFDFLLGPNRESYSKLKLLKEA